MTGKDTAPKHGHGVTSKPHEATVTVIKVKTVTNCIATQTPAQNRLDVEPNTSTTFVPVTTTVTVAVDSTTVTETDTIFRTEADPIFETRTTVETFTLTQILPTLPTSGLWGLPSPSRSPVFAYGSAAPSMAPAMSSWQQQSSRHSSSRATVIGLSVLSALTSIGLLLALLIIFILRRRLSRATHQAESRPNQMLDPFDDSHGVEKVSTVVIQSRDSISSRISDASNMAVLPSIPSRVKSMISPPRASGYPIPPPPITPIPPIPTDRSEPVSGTNTRSRMFSKTSPSSGQSLALYFSRFRRQSRPTITQPQDRVSVASTEQRRRSVDLESEGYSSSMMATVDSVNSSRHSHSDMSLSQAPLSPTSTDVIHSDRV